MEVLSFTNQFQKMSEKESGPLILVESGPLILVLPQ